MSTQACKDVAEPHFLLFLNTKDAEAAHTEHLRADAPTVRHITDELEQALAQCKATHHRKIARTADSSVNR